MKAILIEGKENSGKTTTLKCIRDILLCNGFQEEKKTCGGLESDFSVLLKTDGCQILIHSATDDDKRISELKSNLADCNCNNELDIVITSCRPKDTAQHENVYEVLRVNKINERDIISLNLDNDKLFKEYIIALADVFRK